MSGSQGGKTRGEGPSEQCRSFAPSLAAFGSGALPPEEERAIAAHVATCGWCAARVAAYAEVDALLREAPAPEPPPTLRAGLYARIAAAESRQAPARHRLSALETTVRTIKTHDTPAETDVPTIPPRQSVTSVASSRAARWIGTLAALLVVALLAGLFATQRQQQHGTTPAHHSTATATATAVPQRACAPSEVRANLPARSGLTDLAMTGPGAGWAVGAIADSDISPTTFHSLLLQYRDCQWQPNSASLPNASLMSIAMVSPDEGWAAGEQAHASLLLHYQHGVWTKVVPISADNTLMYSAVRAFSTGEVWVVGQTSAGAGGTTGISLLHLMGDTWTRIDTPFDYVSAISLSGPDDAWLIGVKYRDVSTQVFELAHYHGGALSAELPQASGVQLTDLRMLAPNDGWATGSVYVSGNETTTNPTVTRPVALHYDGSTWAETDTGVRADAHSLFVLGQGEAWSYTLSSSIPQHITVVEREHAGQWQAVSWPYTDIIDLSHLTCTTVDDCWAIGTYLLPDTTRTTGNGQTVTVKGQTQVLLHYTGGAWHEYGHV